MVNELNRNMSIFVSVIIPCREEEKYIVNCLDSILAQDYPPESFEILLADGMSTDRTREILMDYARRFPQIRWFENPGKFPPMGLNRLIRLSKGTVIVRMDAHANYPKDYISKCVFYLQERNVDNVGGVWNTLPASSSPSARAIALVMSNGFGVGNAYFRIRTVKEPRLVDTVPFGCLRRDVFDKIGFFDEEMYPNEDDEFNFRLIMNGGKVLLVPEIVSNYYARESLDKLWRMYYQYGYLKPLGVMKIGRVMTWRQLVPALFVSSLVIAGALSFFHPTFWGIFLLECGGYLLANLAVSLVIALSQGIELFPYLIMSFIIMHFGYGIGYLRGILDFVILRQHLKKKMKDAYS